MDSATAARKAAAERDALLGLAAILTHDLSNPLQSVTVLCELGMDDDDLGEGPRRARQCLEAAERMRGLIHSYAGLVRNVERTSPIKTTIERLLPLFSRRLERHRIELQTRLTSTTDGPPGFGFAMLRMFLGIVHAADCRGGQRHVVELEASDTRVETRLGSTGGDEPPAWPEVIVQDVRAILVGSAEVSLEAASLRIALGDSRP